MWTRRMVRDVGEIDVGVGAADAAADVDSGYTTVSPGEASLHTAASGDAIAMVPTWVRGDGFRENLRLTNWGRSLGADVRDRTKTKRSGSSAALGVEGLQRKMTDAVELDQA